MTTTDGERQPDAASPVPRVSSPWPGVARWASTLPASGAWRPGDPLGERQFLRMAVDRPFVLEGGGQLRDITHRVRDVGRARRRRRQRRARVPRPHRRQPRRRAARAGPPAARLVGRPDRSRPAARHRPATSSCAPTCSAAVRAPPARRRPRPRPAGRYGSDFPVVSIRDMVRTQAALADALGIDRWLSRHRRLDGRHAGARVGGDVPRPGALDRRPSPRAPRPPPSRSPGGAPGAGPSPSTPSGAAATTTTPRPATGPHAGLALARQIVADHVPHRRRVHRPVRARASSSRSTAASRCGSASRSSATSSTTATSWCAASTPTRTCCSPRPWTCTTSAAAAAASTPRSAASRRRRWSIGINSDILYPAVPAARARRRHRDARRRRRATSRSTARTATTRFLHRARPGRRPPSPTFLDRRGDTHDRCPTTPTARRPDDARRAVHPETRAIRAGRAGNGDLAGAGAVGRPPRS